MRDPIRELREALAFSPDNHALRLMLARQLADADRPLDALRELEAVIKAAPPAQQEAARKEAVAAALAVGDGAKALEHGAGIHTLLEPDTQLALARAALSQGKRELARTLYQALLRQDPTLRDLELDRLTRLQVVQPGAPAEEPPQAAAAPAAPPAPPSKPKSSFAEVGGLEALKERLRMDIVYPLQRPDLYKAYGKKMGGGLLFYGPPGCGKTHLARAAAGECGATFLVVEIPQVLDMWLGESEKRLHAIFERARAEAPTILFFDEIEAIGASRHQLKHGPGRRLVNQLLAEMDGATASNESVLVLGATNAPWDVDPALRRPGRFDRVVFVPPPDLPARQAILEIAFAARPHEALDLASIARRTARFSGADLGHLAEASSERALAEALRTNKMRPITQSDLLAVLDKVRPTTTEWLETARRYVAYANQAGQYDDVARYLAQQD